MPASANGRSHVEQLLGGLDRREVFQALARVNDQLGLLDTMKDLLTRELPCRMSTPREPVIEKYLTVDQVAARLGLKRARVYGLVRQGTLPKLAGLGTQVRIPASALNGHGQRPGAPS
jgi:excisionase family DNA binding protein